VSRASRPPTLPRTRQDRGGLLLFLLRILLPFLRILAVAGSRQLSRASRPPTLTLCAAHARGPRRSAFSFSFFFLSLYISFPRSLSLSLSLALSLSLLFSPSLSVLLSLFLVSRVLRPLSLSRAALRTREDRGGFSFSFSIFFFSYTSCRGKQTAVASVATSYADALRRARARTEEVVFFLFFFSLYTSFSYLRILISSYTIILGDI